MIQSKIKIYSAFVLLIILVSYPLFLNLDKLSVRMWDEARNGINAIEMLGNGKLFVTHFDDQPDMWNTKPPFMIWMIALSMKFFGVTTFALRFPSVLAALTIVIYGFWFARKYIQSTNLGFIFGLVLCTSIGFIDHHASRNGDFDTMLAMWIFLYVTQFFLFLENRKQINLILFSIFFGLALLTKGIAACMILPGLAIYFFIDKKNLTLLKSANFYVFSFLGLLIGLSYYIIREQMNPGFIEMVIFNEITGRYAETNEGHSGSIWFYYELLRDYHYKFWIYFIPLALVLIFLRADKKLKKITAFIFLQAIVYFAVITFSDTKLDWYDLPLFPLFALIIAAGFTQLQIQISGLSVLKKSIFKQFVYLSITSLIFIIPLKNIFATSIQFEKETYYPETFYGDFINEIHALFPNQKNLKVTSEGYNPHLIFYIKEKEMHHLNIEIVQPTNHDFVQNDTIMVTEMKFFPTLKEDLVLDTLIIAEGPKLLLRVISYDEYFKNKYVKLFLKKVSEINSDKQWNQATKQKALNNNVTIEKQVMLEALWCLTNAKEISPEEQDSIKVKYNF
ncbi:MAG: glycosyltransferase family 39 protein [Bacteroidetes bacterium]|nr:glycosyltransferase family 39 protein [Bacteroidota bacterium]HET6245533.1 glycosyltransferase family 39 protein [Bacteroidia bacterium]